MLLLEVHQRTTCLIPLTPIALCFRRKERGSADRTMHATMMLQVGICETLQGIPSLVGSLRAKANADHIRLTDWLNLEFLVERSQQRLVLEDCGGIALVHRNPPPSRIRHR